MADFLLQFIQWAIPSGGIGAAIVWFANRKANNAKNAKVVHDTYKGMYEDISKVLLETQQKYEDITKVVEGLTAENHRTRLSINRLSRAIEAIKLCPHRNSCPVSSELSLDEDDDNPGRGKGGKGQRRKQTDHDKIMWMEKVPQDQVHLIIPLDSIGCLPSGVSFGNKQGRANVKASVGKQDGKDVIYIDASCDSLQVLCLYYEEQNKKLAKQNAELSNTIKTEKEQCSNPVKVAIFSFIVGLVSGIIITIKTRKNE